VAKLFQYQSLSVEPAHLLDKEETAAHLDKWWQQPSEPIVKRRRPVANIGITVVDPLLLTLPEETASHLDKWWQQPSEPIVKRRRPVANIGHISIEPLLITQKEETAAHIDKWWQQYSEPIVKVRRPVANIGFTTTDPKHLLDPGPAPATGGPLWTARNLAPRGINFTPVIYPALAVITGTATNFIEIVGPLPTPINRYLKPPTSHQTKRQIRFKRHFYQGMYVIDPSLGVTAQADNRTENKANQQTAVSVLVEWLTQQVIPKNNLNENLGQIFSQITNLKENKGNLTPTASELTENLLQLIPQANDLNEWLAQAGVSAVSNTATNILEWIQTTTPAQSTDRTESLVFLLSSALTWNEWQTSLLRSAIDFFEYEGYLGPTATNFWEITLSAAFINSLSLDRIEIKQLVSTVTTNVSEFRLGTGVVVLTRDLFTDVLISQDLFVDSQITQDSVVDVDI
jgi:hypothetical protein